FRAGHDVAACQLLERSLGAAALVALVRLRCARTDRPAVTTAKVDAVRVAVLGFRIDHQRVGGILGGVEAIATADTEPVVVEDPDVVPDGARAAPAAVVLQAAADVVRLLHVGADRIELPDSHQRDRFPRLSLVVRDVEPAVVAEEDVVVVLRIDPDRVMVAVADAADTRPCPAAIGRLEERRAALVDDLRIRRIDTDLAVVHPAVAVVREELPGVPAVLRAPDPRLVRVRLRRFATSGAASTTAAATLTGLLQAAILVDAGARAA